MPLANFGRFVDNDNDGRHGDGPAARAFAGMEAQMLSIPAPPRPPMDILVAIGVGCVLVGFLLCLRGRSYGKVILALACAAAAAAFSQQIAQLTSVSNVYIVAGVAALLAGVAGFFLANLLWGALLGALLAGATVIGLACFKVTAWPTGPEWTSHTGDWLSWLSSAGEYLGYWVAAFWNANTALMAIEVGIPVVLCCLLGIFRPRAAAIATSSLLGGPLLVTGVGLLVWAFRPEWSGQWIRDIGAPAIAAGVLTLLGLAMQIWLERKNKPKPKPGEGGEPEKKK